MFRTQIRNALRLRPLRSPFVRKVSYQYLHFQNLQTRPSRFKRFLYFNLGLVAMTSFAYYMWWPKHTFPLSVAKILRKGLWAESDRGEKDYQLALKHYLDALQECDDLEMDPLCDEYTGVQLKIAEMYERLDMVDEAAFIYNEIATLYLSVLKADPNSPLGRRIKGIDHRAHLIQKDLRIALKLTQLNRLTTSLCKAILITHLLIAEDEVRRKLGLPENSASLIFGPESSILNGGLLYLDPKKDPTAAAAAASATTGTTVTTVGSGSGKPLGNDVEATETAVLQANPEAWEPFVDEYFNGLDMLTVLCLSMGDITTAARIGFSKDVQMMLADVPVDKRLLSMCNTASVLYCQADLFEAEEQKLRKSFAVAAGVDYDKLKAIHDPLQPISVSGTEAEDIRNQIALVVSPSEKREYEQIVASKDKLIEVAVTMYEAVIAGAKEVQGTPVVAEIEKPAALATYGLGVVYLHLSQYDKAERLLREARVRSRKCGYDELIEEIERELKKVFSEREIVQRKASVEVRN